MPSMIPHQPKMMMNQKTSLAKAKSKARATVTTTTSEVKKIETIFVSDDLAAAKEKEEAVNKMKITNGIGNMNIWDI